MSSKSIFIRDRRYARIRAMLLLLAIVIVFVVEVFFRPWDPNSGMPVVVVLLVWLAAELIFRLRYWRDISFAEQLLDESCDASALATRGDEMGLLSDVPRGGLSRGEMVLLHRYAVALADVGRTDDAALGRRRMEDALAALHKPSSQLDGAATCMLLADVCARLGDASAERSYASAFRLVLSARPVKPSRINDDLEPVGKIILGTSEVLFASEATDAPALDFDESLLSRLVSSGAVGRRLFAEARLALLCVTAKDMDTQIIRENLESIASTGNNLRAGRVAQELLIKINDENGIADFAKLVTAAFRPTPIDVHPAKPRF